MEKNMEKAFEIQKQARENVKTFQTYITDLQNWEHEMKRKEAALNGGFEQDLPPIRSKTKKERPVQTGIKKKDGRIASSDYKAWEKFDVDKACEEVDMEDVGPTSLDSKNSQKIKQEKLREEALYEKEKGNNFVKQEKWDDAISCYNRAIELVKDDAIYYANRGLCYLKKDSLHQAETDCTEALRLDPTYVKALQRRATARERLGSLRAASHDLNEVLKLEPHNQAARKQLEAIKARMGTKGSKSKSSPTTTPVLENKAIVTPPKPKTQPKIEILEQPTEKVEVKEPTASEKWRDGVGENVTIMKPVKKPPHLRSKASLKPVLIEEILLGETENTSAPCHSIVEMDDSLAHGDSNNNQLNKTDKISKNLGDGDKRNEENGGNMRTERVGDVNMPSPESKKLLTDAIVAEKDVCIENMVPPTNSVQFMAEWKYLKDRGNARSDYLSIIDPAKIPSIFENALESDFLSEVIRILHDDTEKFKEKTVFAYLNALCRVKRFWALGMFLSNGDKTMLTKLLNHCKQTENCSDEEIADLKKKYEL